MTILILLGILIGFISGFFGVGGGMVLIPFLLYFNFSLKSAIGISIVQMLLSSIYGSYLNLKHHKNILKDGFFLGLGGFVGGLFSGYIVVHIDEHYLHYLFIAIIMLSIYKLFKAPIQSDKIISTKTSHNRLQLFIIGMIVGLIAMSIGVGGSVMITPILVSYLYFEQKEASSLALFFVIFSASAGLISQMMNTQVMIYEGLIIGFSSFVGVYFGVKSKVIINPKYYRRLLITLNLAIFLYMVYKA